ncbi:hypothetical protein BDV93DRAFT_288021 [Ceratobasidium sp. AG-I]|nr:hypothetical protein BDV93DRAFT_288021 [Ceratobasidium sp. AG-I]
MNSYTTFDANHTGIAKALLSALGRPEATYLELKAVGNAFLCGRCYLDRRCKTWKQMIQHYIKEESSWNNVQMLSRVQDASDFTYSFAHDLKIIKRGKPLIRVASQEERTQPPALPHHGPYKLCRPCKSVDLGYYETVDQVVDHLREVHLINEPQEGIHY